MQSAEIFYTIATGMSQKMQKKEGEAENEKQMMGTSSNTCSKCAELTLLCQELIEVHRERKRKHHDREVEANQMQEAITQSLLSKQDEDSAKIRKLEQELDDANGKIMRLQNKYPDRNTADNKSTNGKTHNDA